MEIKDSSLEYLKIQNEENFAFSSEENKSKHINLLKRRLRNLKKAAIILLILLLFLLARCTSIVRIPYASLSEVSSPRGYLVWSDNCKMPDIDPYSSNTMVFFKQNQWIECPSDISLTRVVFNTTINKYILSKDEETVNSLTDEDKLGLTCCYKVLTRTKEDQVGYSTCLKFEEPVTLSVDTEHILIWCKNQDKPLHCCGYSMMPERDELREHVKDWRRNDTQKPINVILLGIDSISRASFIRGMPKTAQYLYDNDWFEMSGYNKMGLNTFPNLMAILTGFNENSVENQCNPTEFGGLDRCPFIWKTFKDHGYATAYAEDSPSFSTFNYEKRGFLSSPVDYYFRTFILGAKFSLPVTKKYCVGSKPEAFYVFDYALELDARYENDSYFGLFWTNACHGGDLNDILMMDDIFLRYLKKFSDRGVLERSVVVLLSDHGIRWGEARRTLSGFFEARRPFFFIWLPPWLRYAHPDFVEVLRMNNNRLTSPYDLHMTLKHILEISGRSLNLPHAQDCPKCQSLLKPMPFNRTCADAAIPDIYCTCFPLYKIDKDSIEVEEIAQFSVEYINAKINNYNVRNHVRCLKHCLNNIEIAFTHTVPNNVIDFVYYVVVFSTNNNNAFFETLAKVFTKNDNVEILGVSRVSPESSKASEVPLALKQFC